MVVLPLLAALGLQGAAPPREASPPPPPPPNVVLIMTDDQGLGDFGHAGHAALETPNLDRLEAESPKVARFYVSPVCSPTRASLMTGRYNYRTRVVDTWIGRSMMDPDERTIAEVLGEAGYATGIFGKWHLGDCYPLRPIDQGFDEALVHRGGGIAQPSEPPENERRYTDPILFRNGAQVETEGYCTDVYFDAALGFIDASRVAERPFFAYVATNAPHDPYHDVPPELYEKYLALDMEAAVAGKSDKLDREARICAMVENIDQNVGRLLAYLERNGLAKTTIVCFLNDNGPVWGRFSRGLRGFKTEVYEGGIRAPLFVRWPGELDPSNRVDPIAAHIDLFPTLLELCGVALPPGSRIDGRSLVPLLRGEENANWPERELFLQTHRGNTPVPEHHFAVIGERWKLVRASGFGKQSPDPEHPFELFDLIADPFETDDLAADRPDLVRAMRSRYRAWYDDVAATRANNFEPPRIAIGDPAEPVSVLTRQDRRSNQGEGWGNAGAWWMRADARHEAELILLFAKEARFDTAHVRIGTTDLDFEGAKKGRRISLGRVPFPTGPFELRVDLEDGGETVSVHQVVVDTRPSSGGD